MMFISLLTVMIGFLAQGVACKSCNVTVVSRSEWGARAPNDHDHLNTPVTVAIVHHTDMGRCHTKDECISELQGLQGFHMDNQSHSDIMYNFMIGEDGNVYQGRGWDVVGGHVPGWNSVSLAFAVIGDFETTAPNQDSLDALKNMLECGVVENKLTSDFKIYGHREMSQTNCPGTAFYNIIKKWHHYGGEHPLRPTKTPYHD